MAMYPASRLADSWEYYVAGACSEPQEPRRVSRITCFDPACGSGHFLLEAFDIFFEMYREELAKVGKPDPGPMPEAPATVTFVADNPDEYWDAIAPHVQHETNIYAEWSTKAGTDSPYKHYDNTDELRDAGAYKVYRPQELIEVAGEMSRVQPIMFHPLCGGIHPDLAWDSLRLWSEEVLPALREGEMV